MNREGHISQRYTGKEVRNTGLEMQRLSYMHKRGETDVHRWLNVTHTKLQSS